MTDKEKWLELRNCISMGGSIERDQTQWTFDKALQGIELTEKVEQLEMDIGFKRIAIKNLHKERIYWQDRYGEQINKANRYENALLGINSILQETYNRLPIGYTARVLKIIESVIFNEKV